MLDKHDQVIASYSIMRRYLKWYRKLFVYFLDETIFNSSCIFFEYHELNSRDRFTKFRFNIVKQIISEAKKPNYNIRTYKTIDDPNRFFSPKNHIPEKIPPTEKQQYPKLRCKVCYETQNKRRHDTRQRCNQCKIALCSECFDSYHTLNI